MREKILSRLKEKFPGVNLSKKRMDAIADRLTPKIKEESEIDAKLDELNDIMPFADIAKEDDRVRNLEVKLKEKEKPKPTATSEDDGDSEDDDASQQQPPAKDKGRKKKTDEPPAWAKVLLDKVTKLESEKVQTSMQSKRKQLLKDVPEDFYDLIPVPESEDDLEDHVEKIQSKWNKINDGKIEEKLANGTKPVNGAAPAKDGKEKEATKEELDKIMPNII